MNMPDNRKSWNEFDWERELRMDESRIHYYFMELPHFIDLPGEEEIILKQMKLNPELISMNDNWDEIGSSMFFEDFDDDVFLSDDWVQKDSAKLYTQLSRLASQWNMAFASEIAPEFRAEAMHIICLYGRAMAQTSELLDANNEEMPGFIICVGKRLHAGINLIIGKLTEFIVRQQDMEAQIKSYINHLQSLREKLLDLVAATREKQDKN